jgi:hypothetical protein
MLQVLQYRYSYKILGRDFIGVQFTFEYRCWRSKNIRRDYEFFVYEAHKYQSYCTVEAARTNSSKECYTRFFLYTLEKSGKLSIYDKLVDQVASDFLVDTIVENFDTLKTQYKKGKKNNGPKTIGCFI